MPESRDQHPDQCPESGSSNARRDPNVHRGQALASASEHPFFGSRAEEEEEVADAMERLRKPRSGNA
jgi:hypothetical protein